MHFTGKTTIAYLRLIRFPNLLMIIVTMVLVRYGLVQPLLTHLPGEWQGQHVVVPGLTLKLADWQFALLVVSTVLITAAGYVIHDYFDTRTDLVNRPHRVIVGKEVSRRSAMALHLMLNIMGVGAGVGLSFAIGFPFLGFIFFPVAFSGDATFVSYSVIFILPFVIATTYAIIRYRLMDIRAAIARSLSFSALLGAFFAIYGAMLIFAVPYLADLTGVREGIIAATGALLAVLLARYVQEVMRRLTDKFLFQNRVNYRTALITTCLLYTSPSPRDLSTPRMPSSA